MDINSIITITLCSILIIIAIIFWVRSKLTGLIAHSLKLAFLFFLILSLVGIFVPQAYDFGADFVLRQTGVHSQIEKIDNDFPVQKLIDAPGNIFDFFGNNDDENVDESETGFFENSLYPSFVSIFAFLLRLYSLIVSFVGLIAVVYLSYISTTITDTENMKMRIKTLEQRIAALEGRTI